MLQDQTVNAHPRRSLGWRGLVLLALGTANCDSVAGEPAAGNRVQAAKVLQWALDGDRGSRSDAALRLLNCQRAVREALTILDPASQAAATLGAALEASTHERPGDAQTRLDALRPLMARVQQDLAFQVVHEADLPQGFPACTPAGEIAIKEYPAYRMACAMRASGLAFWQLFRHIQAHAIPMSAPVQIDYRPAAAGRLEEDRMAFLYVRPDQGRVGVEGSVEVRDVPPGTVVSLGRRGVCREAHVGEARQLLTAWLAAHAPQHVACGEPRVMGYNSPFLPSERQFYEVQLPLQRRATP